MADISITDQLKLSAAVTINDDSALSIAKLAKLNFASLPIVGDLAKPIDQCSFQQASLGAALSSPGMLLGDQAALTITAGENGTLYICPDKSKTLFESDGCTPDIVIQAGQCWVGLELSTLISEQVAAKVDGIGVSVTQGNEVRFGTYLLFNSAPNPLPTLQQGVKTLLEKYAIGTSVDAMRSQPIGTVRTVGTKGEVCLSASYSLPLTIDPLASANLPFQNQLSFQPSATIQLSGSMTLSGEFVVRFYRPTNETLVFGLYKKKDTTFAAAFTAGAGIGADIGGKDVLTPVLNAVLPRADFQSLNLDEKQTDQLKSALKSCVDQSFAVALNARCSASVADEAAVIYSIDLTQARDQTNTAIGAALKGDWSAFENLPNAKQIRNVVREIHDRKHQLNINLLGILNSTSVRDYVQSCTVLQDGTGKIVLIDEEAAKTLSATDAPYAARPDKLRSALAQSFLATVSYSATIGAANPKLAIKSFTVRQSFLDYKAKASAQDMRRYILLARCLGLPVASAWDSLLQGNPTFTHAKCCLDTQYTLADVMQMFYADPAKRVARSQQELDKLGRDTKISLLDPTIPNAAARRMALSSNTIWNAMSDDGNPARFRFIDGLGRLPDTALGIISADWVDIRWWSNAMQQIPAKLTAVLKALDASTTDNPTEDRTFMSCQKELQTVLANVAANAQSAFGDGWGMAVIHSCAAGTPFTQMDIGWNDQFEHYETGSRVAAGASGG